MATTRRVEEESLTSSRQQFVPITITKQKKHRECGLSIVVEEKLAVVKKLLTGRTVRFDIVEQPYQFQQLLEDLVKTEFEKKALYQEHHVKSKQFEAGGSLSTVEKQAYRCIQLQQLLEDLAMTEFDKALSR